MTQEDIKKIIFSDGIITDDELELIRAYLADDGGMNIEKGNFLFDLKNKSTKGRLPAAFKDLFVESICSLLLEDEQSPGEIDDSEAKWLRARIQYNGRIDEYDKLLLENLKKKSINFPKVLQYKSLRTRDFERVLYSLRYLSVLAVIGAAVSSIVLFIQGVVLVYWGLEDYFTKIFSSTLTPAQQSELYEHLFQEIVSSVDVFLFALVLIIFGVGVYELFVSKIDPVEREVDNRPSWLRINSVDDLKSSLGKVILMVLIVSFFKRVLQFQVTDGTISYFWLAAGIFLIAGALYLTHKSHDKHHADGDEDDD